MREDIKVSDFSNVDKRYAERVKYDLELYYPCVNNKSVYEQFGSGKPLMETINISETGMCFNSRVPVNTGDFLSFSLTIKDNPSFWCLSEVKWVKNSDEDYILGCEFYCLSSEQTKLIKNYIEEIHK